MDMGIDQAGKDGTAVEVQRSARPAGGFRTEAGG